MIIEIFRKIIKIIKLKIFRNRTLREVFKKKNSGYNEFGTKGGRVSDLNHYFKHL